MPFSRKTQTRLAEGIAHAFSHSDLDTLFFEYEVEGDPGNGAANKVTRSMRLVRGLIEQRPGHADADLLELANRVLAYPFQRERLSGLTAALALDGYEWAQNALVASNPGPAALAPETTALEQELRDLGLDVAARHYGQAVENYTDGNHEASNGQLRSSLEDLIKGAARLRGLQQDASPDVALQHLRTEGVLDGEEFGMFRSLWHGTQDNGPHAGLTDPDEARFRIQSITAFSRYLVKKIAQQE